MKKLVTCIALLTIFILCAVLPVGCGSKSSTGNNLVGTYYNDEDGYMIVLKSDGTCTSSLISSPTELDDYGTYEVKGNEITFMSDKYNNTSVATIADGRIMSDDQGSDVIYEKR